MSVAERQKVRLVRVMAGEYLAEFGDWTYSIDAMFAGCDKCAHKHEWWSVRLHHKGSASVHICDAGSLGKARWAVAEHASKLGVHQ